MYNNQYNMHSERQLVNHTKVIVMCAMTELSKFELFGVNMYCLLLLCCVLSSVLLCVIHYVCCYYVSSIMGYS